ncbi:MAG TPA: type I-U CRISPR-associated protein Cas5/Cas6 [Deltaproteobacteria bacterium]|nr:type I-U CRISPR-associated protein Cas5/Cas6 [Deltaproteobacteria bacterium]
MLCLEIEYLTGRCVATAYNDRSRPEWPPQPARVFSALVASVMEDEADPAELEVLTWLEGLGPPSIAATQAPPRSPVTVFVPVNDLTTLRTLNTHEQRLGEAERALERLRHDPGAGKALPRAVRAVESARGKLEAAGRRAAAVPDKVPTPNIAQDATRLLPERRLRHPRTFPSVTPTDPVVQLIWPDAEPSGIQRDVLQRVVQRVVRIGHSASLVRCALTDEARPPTHAPDPDGSDVFRVPGPGQLQALDEAYAYHRGSVSGRILPARFVRYGPPRSEPMPRPPAPVFSDEWIVFRRVGGPRLPITRAPDVARALRGALLSYADHPRQVLTGHQPDGAPAREPHAAYLALPFVGRQHATGHLMGVAIVLPRGLARDDRMHVLQTIGRWEAACRQENEPVPTVSLRLGRAGVLDVERHDLGDLLASLRAGTWCRASARWATATPIALDRNPGDLRHRDPRQAAGARDEAAATVALAAVRIGLPAPTSVEIDLRPPLMGGQHIRHHPPFPRDRSRTRRVQVHARLTFPGPVVGPVLLGAGRYQGLGLLRPLSDGGERA